LLGHSEEFAVDDLLTLRQVKELLQVDRITIYRMLEKGRLPGFKLGGRWYFSRPEIEAWLSGQRTQTHSAAPVEPIPSTNSLPLSCIEAVQNILGEALGVAALTTDMAGQPVTDISHSCRFCSLIRSTPEGRRLCTNSWVSFALGMNTHHARRCHAGLRYRCELLQVAGQGIAIAIAGQYVASLNDIEEIAGRLPAIAKAVKVDEEQLRAQLPTVHILEEAYLERLPAALRQVARAIEEFYARQAQFVGRLQQIADLALVKDIPQTKSGAEDHPA
jgi:excisionase family DNA binding protein